MTNNKNNPNYPICQNDLDNRNNPTVEAAAPTTHFAPPPYPSQTARNSKPDPANRSTREAIPNAPPESNDFVVSDDLIKYRSENIENVVKNQNVPTNGKRPGDDRNADSNPTTHFAPPPYPPQLARNHKPDPANRSTREAIPNAPPESNDFVVSDDLIKYRSENIETVAKNQNDLSNGKRPGDDRNADSNPTTHFAPPPYPPQLARNHKPDPANRSTREAIPNAPPESNDSIISDDLIKYRSENIETVAKNQNVPTTEKRPTGDRNADSRQTPQSAPSPRSPQVARAAEDRSPSPIRGVQPLKAVLTSLNGSIDRNDRNDRFDRPNPSNRNVRNDRDFRLDPPPRNSRAAPDVCPECGGSGSIFSTRNGATWVRDCSCAIRARQERLWKRAGFDRCNLDVPLGRTGQVFVDRFDSIRRSPRNWVLYAGKTGSGKTTQAGLIVRRLIDRPNPVLSRMLSFFDLLRVTSGLWNSFRQDELSQKIEETFDVDLIVVDDFLKGARRESNADFKATCGVMDYLYRIRKPVVLTTEFLPEEIAKFDGATAGRIVELCDGRIVTFDQTAENYRLRRFSQAPVFA